MESTGFLFPTENRKVVAENLAAKWEAVAASPRNWSGIKEALGRRERALRPGREREVLTAGSPHALGRKLGAELRRSGALDFYESLWGDDAPREAWRSLIRPIDYAEANNLPGALLAFPTYLDEIRASAEIDIQDAFSEYLQAWQARTRRGREGSHRKRTTGGREFLDGVRTVHSGDLVWHLRDAALFNIFRHVGGFVDVGGTDFLLDAACHGLGILAETHTRVYAVAFPLVVHNDANRLHNPKGPAITWENGRRAYFLHGVEVDREIILNPASLDLKRILSEQDTERRRVYTLRYGVDRFLKESGARLIHRTPRGILWKSARRGFGRLTAVQVECPSTGRHYFLRVPPNIRSVDAAVAWTFGLDARTYRPAIET